MTIYTTYQQIYENWFSFLMRAKILFRSKKLLESPSQTSTSIYNCVNYQFLFFGWIDTSFMSVPMGIEVSPLLLFFGEL